MGHSEDKIVKDRNIKNTLADKHKRQKQKCWAQNWEFAMSYENNKENIVLLDYSKYYLVKS